MKVYLIIIFLCSSLSANIKVVSSKDIPIDKNELKLQIIEYNYGNKALQLSIFTYTNEKGSISFFAPLNEVQILGAIDTINSVAISYTFDGKVYLLRENRFNSIEELLKRYVSQGNLSAIIKLEGDDFLSKEEINFKNENQIRYPAVEVFQKFESDLFKSRDLSKIKLLKVSDRGVTFEINGQSVDLATAEYPKYLFFSKEFSINSQNKKVFNFFDGEEKVSFWFYTKNLDIVLVDSQHKYLAVLDKTKVHIFQMLNNKINDLKLDLNNRDFNENMFYPTKSLLTSFDLLNIVTQEEINSTFSSNWENVKLNTKSGRLYISRFVSEPQISFILFSPQKGYFHVQFLNKKWEFNKFEKNDLFKKHSMYNDYSIESLPIKDF